MEQRLRELTSERISTREISKQLSFDFKVPITPQSVRAKCDRMGIKLSPLPTKDSTNAYLSPVAHKRGKEPRFWTKEREAKLREMVDAGMTYQQIGYQLCKGRGAIASKCKKLGIASIFTNQDSRRVNETDRARIISEARDYKAKERAEYFKDVRRQVKVRNEKGYKPQPPNMDRIKFEPGFKNPEARKVTLIKLKSNWCHFPVGDPRDPDFRYCGADVLLGSPVPYCETCRRIVYVQNRGSTSVQKLHR